MKPTEEKATSQLASANRNRVWRFLKNTGLCCLVTLCCFLFVLLVLRVTPPARAQGTPTPTPTPTCTATPAFPSPTACNPFVNSGCGTTPVPTPNSTVPPATPIPSPYQPKGHDGTNTQLYWRVWVPLTGSSWPAILILHEGHFAGGSIYGGTVAIIAGQLRDQGYIVFVGDYRLAPCGLIAGQPMHDNTLAGIASGRPPQQMNDVKSLIAAARADIRCNGKLGVLGGSSGATHAAWAAIDRVDSTRWPQWNEDLWPDAIVCLSGAYDFSDRSMPGTTQDAFVEKVQNYTNKCQLSDLRELSVVRLIELSATPNIKPIFAVNADNETMPLPQLFDLQCALQSRGVSSSLYQTLVVPNNSSHAFGYYFDWDGVNPVGNAPTLTVGSHVIAFFNQYLNP